jgi:AcrR family transcriptional regulator
MRLLAKRLDSGTATLYRHVVSKEELMVYVVDHLLGEIQLAGERSQQQPRNWRDAARSVAMQFHRVLTDHPNALPVLVSQVPIGPNALARREQSIATLVRFGFSPQLAARAYTTIAQYVIGSAVVQPGSPGPQDAAALAAYYRTLDPDAYPLTVAAADTLTATSVEDGFRQGLELLLDGIDSAHRRQRAHGA